MQEGKCRCCKLINGHYLPGKMNVYKACFDYHWELYGKIRYNMLPACPGSLKSALNCPLCKRMQKIENGRKHKNDRISF